MDDHTQNPDDASQQERYGLAELAEAAGVSVRTVRYYIAEGLLPPPEGGGARSAYTQGHLDRLRLIARLKAAYLPLRAIRQRLAGLDDAATRALLEAHAATAARIQAGERPPSLGSAAAYLSRLLPPSPSPAPAAPEQRAAFIGKPPPVPEQQHEGWPEAEEALRAELDRGAVLAESLSPVPYDAPESWRRVTLGPDVELLIREETYQRRQDKIAWLIDWAKKVLN